MQTQFGTIIDCDGDSEALMINDEILVISEASKFTFYSIAESAVILISRKRMILTIILIVSITDQY